MNREPSHDRIYLRQTDATNSPIENLTSEVSLRKRFNSELRKAAFPFYFSIGKFSGSVFTPKGKSLEKSKAAFVRACHQRTIFQKVQIKNKMVRPNNDP